MTNFESLKENLNSFCKKLLETEKDLTLLGNKTQLSSLKSEIQKQEQPGKVIYKGISSDGYKVYSYIVKEWALPGGVKNQAIKQLKLKTGEGIKITDIKGVENYDKLHQFKKGEKVYIKVPKNIETNSGKFKYTNDSEDGKYKVYSYIIKSGGGPNAVIARAIDAGLANKKNEILITRINGVPYEENDKFSAGDKVYVKILKKKLDSRESPNKHVVSEQRMYNKIIKYGVTNKNQIAYILATVKHEAPNRSFGFKNQKEIGGSKKYYSPYYGRGFVQLTHKSNYEKFTKIIKSSGKVFKDNNGKTLDLNKIDLINEPDIILESNDLSAFITVYGMKHGLFTGKKLDDFINNKKTDFINARRIINGKDKAHKIAKYANKYLKNLNN